MMRRLLLWIVLAVAVSGQTWGWGADVHRLVGEIAWLDLTPATREQVLELLAGDRGYYRYFSAASLWADREGKRGAYRDTRHHHYVNVPPEATEVRLAESCRDGCVISAIVVHAGTLLREPRAGEVERREALKYLIHLVADVHQPLHVAYAADRGGNEVEVEFLGRRRNNDRGPPLSLHRVWDTELLAEEGLTSRNARERAVGFHRAITEEQRTAWSGLDPVSWADESLTVVREQVYAGEVLDEDYYRRAAATSRRRIQQAGVRLARLLNAIFDPRSADPPFTVSRRGGRVFHEPGCPEVAAIEPRRLVVHLAPPEKLRPHESCTPDKPAVSGNWPSRDRGLYCPGRHRVPRRMEHVES